MPPLSRLPAWLALPPALLLAACGSADDAAPDAAATPAAIAANPAAPVDAAGLPLVPGEWQVTEDAVMIRASFQSPEGKSLLSLTCDLAGKVITLAVSNPAPGNTAFALQAGGTAARLDTVTDGNAADPHQAAAIAPDAPVFVGFVQPGGTIEVSQPGGTALRVPATSVIGRVFENCR